MSDRDTAGPQGVRFEQILIEPAYRKVAAAIGERIVSRSLREGERLPPETELARLTALGARPADVGQDGTESWVVLQDPEGNEFCLRRNDV